jgi:hypothetical protein
LVLVDRVTSTSAAARARSSSPEARTPSTGDRWPRQGWDHRRAEQKRHAGRRRAVSPAWWTRLARAAQQAVHHRRTGCRGRVAVRQECREGRCATNNHVCCTRAPPLAPFGPSWLAAADSCSRCCGTGRVRRPAPAGWARSVAAHGPVGGSGLRRSGLSLTETRPTAAMATARCRPADSGHCWSALVNAVGSPGSERVAERPPHP